MGVPHFPHCVRAVSRVNATRLRCPHDAHDTMIPFEST